MDLNINNEFSYILLFVFGIGVFFILATILYEAALPTSLNGYQTGFVALIIIIIIGFSFTKIGGNVIPNKLKGKPISTLTSKEKNKIAKNEKIAHSAQYRVYLIILFTLTAINFLT